MNIRTMRQNEIPAAAKIIGTNYSKKYQQRSTKEMEAMFKNHVYKPEYIVAEDGGKIIGLAGCIESWMDYSVYQIFWVNVLPEHQMKGIGTELVNKLMRKIKKHAEAQFILISTDKPEFYMKLGFRELAELKGKYRLMIFRIRK